MFVIKIGRNEYEITPDDRFMDNGACVQLITQKGPFKKWNYESLILPKREINRLEKMGRIEHSHRYGSNISIFSVKEEN